MAEVHIRPDNDLLFFTAKKYGRHGFLVSFRGRRSVKDLLESVGIPHVEIGSIRLSGKPVPIDFVLSESCSLEVDAITPGLPDLPGEPVFILDVHLGKLAVNLRMLGFSVDYSNCRNDPELAGLTSGGGILLSCDRGLMMRKCLRYGMLIRSREPDEQAVEVLRRYDLTGGVRLFSRCFNCGAPLEQAGFYDELDVPEQLCVPIRVRSRCIEYSRCTGCGQLFWKGSHFSRLEKKAAGIVEAARGC